MNQKLTEKQIDDFIKTFSFESPLLLFPPLDAPFAWKKRIIRKRKDFSCKNCNTSFLDEVFDNAINEKLYTKEYQKFKHAIEVWFHRRYCKNSLSNQHTQ